MGRNGVEEMTLTKEMDNEIKRIVYKEMDTKEFHKVRIIYVDALGIAEFVNCAFEERQDAVDYINRYEMKLQGYDYPYICYLNGRMVDEKYYAVEQVRDALEKMVLKK